MPDRTEAETFYAKGLAAAEHNNLDAAQAHWRAAWDLDPSFAEPARSLVVLNFKQAQFDQAEHHARDGRQHFPNDPFFALWLGHILAQTDRPDAARAPYGDALAMAPDQPDVWHLLGLCERDCGSYRAATTAFEAAIAHNPNDVESHFELGQLLLLQGQTARGLAHYEWRLKRQIRPPTAHNIPQWDGQNPGGKTLLVTAEQGAGDVIHFYRYAMALAGQNAAVTLECHAPLVPLLAPLGKIGVVPFGGVNGTFDGQIPLMSLPQFLPPPPPSPPYLRADAGLVDIWRDRLGRRDAHPRIGLVWQGSALHHNDAARSCGLDALAPLLNNGNYVFHSLQIDPAAGPNAAAINDHCEVLTDFAQTTALIANLDAVVAIDTAALHLAGALGIPTWGLLAFVPDWRWGEAGADTAWYPSVRLLRQSRAGDWSAPILTLIDQLHAHFGHHSN